MENQLKSRKWSNNFPNCFKGENYSQHKGRLIKDISDLEDQIERLKQEITSLKEKQLIEREEEKCKLSNIIFSSQPCNFSTLQSELKRLKIQDLTIQIPLKKQEYEQLTNNLKNNLNNSGKYLLNKY